MEDNNDEGQSRWVTVLITIAAIITVKILFALR